MARWAFSVIACGFGYTSDVDIDPIADLAPDWSQASVPELCCPLCEYNLRGLDQPRCPECGFVFTWSELIRGQREVHPYLFEHQLKRNIWSFVKTYVNDSRPRVFWRGLNPAQPVRIGRLLLYWLIANLLIIGAFVYPFGSNLWDACHAPPQPVFLPRLISAAQSNGLPGFSPVGVTGTNPTGPIFRHPLPPPGVQSPSRFYLLPPPTFRQNVQTAFDTTLRLVWRSSLIPSVIVVLIWPWITLLALLVFSQSMRKAKIRKRHLVRAVVYGTDFGLIAMLGLILESGTRSRNGGPMFIAIMCAAFTLYRLYFAYSRYLRFHLPFWTVLASQVIGFLVVFTVYRQAWSPY